MSALQKPGTVAQLAEMLSPHTVLVHHDYTKQPDFRIDLPNVRFVPEPKETGWGNWGLTDGIYHTLQHAVRTLEFDYFQLMSPTCLPIRPLSEFEAHIRADTADIHGDFFDISADPEMTMIFSSRVYAPANSLRLRVLRRAQRWYFGKELAVAQHVSLSIRKRADPRPLGPMMAARARLAYYITQLAPKGILYPHPFTDSFRPHIGSTWIGLNRKATEFIAGTRTDPRIESHFRHLPIVDEITFPTFLANSGLRVSPGNHVINTFTVAGSPEWITDSDLDRMLQSHLYFARKFPDDKDASVRQRVVTMLRPISA